jgi:putative ABC transport system substrate-binding protein
MISRRAVARGLAVALVAAPLAASAQQAVGVFRIGILANYRLGKPDLWDIFIQELRELGYVEGRNITIEWRVSEGRYERLPEQAAELARLRVDVIVVPANQNALAAKQATRTIPVVMIGITDPVGSGFVTSLARPGGNMTGLSASVGPEMAGKQLELLKVAVPQASRVAILWNPGNPAHALMLKEAEAVARSLKVQLQPLEARGPEDFGSAFAAMNRERAGAVLILGDGMFSLHQARVADLVTKSRLPTLGSRAIVTDGVLMSYQASQPDLWRRAAAYVDKILKGAKPGDLPVQQPTKFDLAINRKTARALGLTIPPSVLARADEIIE